MINSNGRKTIALVIENFFTDFAEEFIQNVVSGIRQRRDLDLVLIAGIYDGTKDMDDRHHAYRMIYNSIYQLESKCRFDGILVCLGSMCNVDRDYLLKRFDSKIYGVPMIFSISDVEDRITVNYDNTQGITEALNALINVHGFTRFCMLGGRPDNVDSRKRRDIYTRVLNENGIEFTEDQYEATYMSVNCKNEALALLDRNPDVEAIFCVNDSVAVGLYEAMEERRLVPGKDIMVFGFDNTNMAGRMIPTLTSIGADNITLGRRSLELLVDMMNGEDVQPTLIPTRLYGRESFPYEMYEYNVMELLNVETDFIYRMFDDCFYRYRYEHISRESVNLKRLFMEFISKILMAVKQRYMSMEDYNEAKELIDIFFENGALRFSDAGKLLRSIDRLQNSVNNSLKSGSSGNNAYIDHLFTHMRDAAIMSLAEDNIRFNDHIVETRQTLSDYMVDITNFFDDDTSDSFSNMIMHFDKLGLPNAALFLFDEPAIFSEEKEDLFPDNIYLHCLTKEGELYVLPKERQSGRTSDMFRRSELPPKCRECAAFPIFYRKKIYGFLVSELTKDIATTGEFIANQLGRLFYTAIESDT